ncbi:carbohydrate ABC transporter permease [Alkalibacterium pelagium]|uniref:Carbohydrate ABC transporter membrane protein 1, CUT1 family n=1 Tax=Alkalibacterium pelagium TaxID=426702 RepID=A0A1H7IK67_9LACT|nr:sugar ABC transporter permease [Alkalibacterium pelagium]GEN50066.1 spermidine/putrescine ABC transporter permease [Alkalibacterium pelagium]SEK61125.1 carbohydrate ABC transporter membrane protein 1, CUT1 family [Alkalibacterium pelagium]
MLSKKRSKLFYLFVFPWIFGFLFLTAGPMLYSLYLSFTNSSGFGTPDWVGLDNYSRMFNQDPLFWKSLGNTFFYTALSVPLSLVTGYLLAVLLNTKVKFMGVFRTIFYLPSIVPTVATSLLWMLIFQPNFGIANAILDFFGLPTSLWLLSEQMVKPTLVIMSLWGIGGGMVIYLAGLQEVPKSLYEAADMDGASTWRKFFNITVPMTSPVIFFQLIMGLIGALQVFTQAYVVSSGSGGPNYQSLFFVFYLYQQGFRYFNQGYGSAMAWILFFLVLILTGFIFNSVGKKVYYESGD